MNKQLTLILSLMAYPLAAMEKPTLEQYLKNKEAEDHSYIGSSICGVEIVINKKNRLAGHLLSCPQAKEFLQTLSQVSDKADYSIAHLKMTKSGNRPEEKYDISIEQAQTELAVFSASAQTRITKFQETAKQENLQEYQNQYGSISKQ